MDDWREDAQPGHTHDPNEVTVQLDGVGRRIDELITEEKQPGGQEVPVFVDDSGRRSRRLRRIGMAVGIACAVYAVVIVATLLSGNSSAPWLPMPSQKDEIPAGKVETSPLPAETASPSGSARTTPGATPSDNDRTAPSPDAGTSRTASPSTGTATPGVSAEPDPTNTTEPDPGESSQTPDPGPSGEPPSVSPDPQPSGSGGPTGDPSLPPAAGGPDTVADSPVEPVPASPSPSGSSFPENIL